ncbi:hypothetical protein [uncultured Muribaculum sp.]|uniref:hypothetical protein n=1 Tax=uncultured Muribaculum sp. TaxID=1918613 RepID=UPI00259282BF|nr:hypothetical protein [uncultured Muribaculum sp.]
MKEKNPVVVPDDGLEKWKGYTLADLRYQRAINHVRMEMERERLANSMTRLNDMKSKFTLPGNGLLQKVFAGFSIFDYALLAITTGKQIRKVYRFFKK